MTPVKILVGSATDDISQYTVTRLTKINDFQRYYPQLIAVMINDRAAVKFVKSE